jgi:tRNA(fMet)-specific endonuclease VapC
MSFLLDTDICSAHLKGNRTVSSHLLQYSGRLHISALSVSELFTWAKRNNAPPARLIAVRELLLAMQFLDVNLEIAEKAGELRAMLLDQGKPLPNLDLHIAATALVHGLTLVTHNVRHFSPVPQLSIDDWLISSI